MRLSNNNDEKSNAVQNGNMIRKKYFVDSFYENKFKKWHFI